MHLSDCQECLPTALISSACVFFFLFAAPCPNKHRGYRMRKQVTWLFSLLYCIFMSENTAHDNICALSGCVCVLTILCLFVIKLVQACRARPPRAVTHTPSLPTKKSLVLIISILWARLSAQNRHLNHPQPPPPTNSPQTLPRPYGKNFWWTH